MSNIMHKIGHEIKAIIPPTIFFFFAFQLIAFTQSLMLEQYGIKFSAFLNATIGALVVAKVVLIADLFPFVNKFPHKPLIYNVVWKTIIYFIASLLVRYIEQLFHFWGAHPSLGAATTAMFGEIIWPHFWAVQLWLIVLFLAFCTLRELVRALGKQKIKALFFGPIEEVAEH